MDMSTFAVPKPLKRVKTPKRQTTGNEYRDRSISQEDRVAAELTQRTRIPFRRVKMSGAAKEKPGDVRTAPQVRLPSHRWLLELKMLGRVTARGAKVLSVEWDWLVQVIKEAMQENCIPALIVGYPNQTQEWVLIRKEDYERLLREHHDMNEYLEGVA